MITDQLREVLSGRDQTRYSVVTEVEPGSAAPVTDTLSDLGVTFNTTRVRRKTLVSFAADETTIRRVAQIPQVIRVDYNGTFTPLGAAPGEVGTELRPADDVRRISLRDALERLRVPEAWEAAGSRGEGVDVGVIDTPIAETHPAFDGKIAKTAANVGSETHGTWVASAMCGSRVETSGGVVQGAAPDANLYAHGALKGGSADITQIADGVNFMIEEGVDVVNLSFGGSHSEVLQSVVAEAHDAGVTIVSSVGNSGPNLETATCPAHHGTTLSVGSIGPDGSPAGFSSRGPGWSGQTVPQVVAYGGRSEQGDRDQLVTESVLGAAAPSGGQYLVGTSMASPQVAGITALRVGVEQ